MKDRPNYDGHSRSNHPKASMRQLGKRRSRRRTRRRLRQGVRM